MKIKFKKKTKIIYDWWAFNVYEGKQCHLTRKYVILVFNYDISKQCALKRKYCIAFWCA